jgi:hypothetical protein
MEDAEQLAKLHDAAFTHGEFVDMVPRLYTLKHLVGYREG